MKKDFSISITVKARPAEAFAAINNVTKWWTENLEGSSKKLNDEFTVRFGDVHYSKQKLVEYIPDQKVVWLITDSKLSFVKDKQEWTDTQITFDVFASGDKTHVVFTHIGLEPAIECYEACSDAWSGYIKGSLKDFINTGQGQPERKE